MREIILGLKTTLLQTENRIFGLHNDEEFLNRLNCYFWRACNTHGGEGATYMILVGEPEGKSSLGRSRLGWEDDMKIFWEEPIVYFPLIRH
jgi:hypothetical protein